MSKQGESTANQKTNAEKPKVRIEQKQAFLVAGLRYEGKNEHGEIPAMWDLFLPRAGELVMDTAHLVAYGVARALPNSGEGAPFEYLAGVEVASLDKLPPGMVGWEIPALTCAVFPAHDVPDIGPVNDYFFREWLPHSQEYTMGEGLMIEYYPETFGQDMILYLYFPIKRK
jgi:predicted transcriptional regulator YdeE